MNNISIITCCDKYGGIAKNKQIPWLSEVYTKDDLNNFKNITNGSVCVMGVNTYSELFHIRKAKTEGIIEHILPDRVSYVVTSKPLQYANLEGATAVTSIRQAYDNHYNDMTRGIKKVFILGGSRLYTEALAFATEVHMTIIDQDFECDSFFPISKLSNRMVITEGHVINEHMKYIKYSRK